MKNKIKAFTLVELIVAITILAILGTIAFISLSGYSAEARDSKRISDTRSLLNKINIENTRGIPLSDLISEEGQETGQILGIPNRIFQTMGEANFTTLKENQNNFQDPSNNKDYPIAYAIGGTGSGAYTFMQIATISEKDNTTKILGNYYTKESNDIASLFTEDGNTYFEEGDTPIYDIYTGTTSQPNGPSEGIEQTGQLADGSNFTWQDLTFSYNGTSYTLMDRNLGATIVYSSGTTEPTTNVIGSSQFYGNYYQWGRNDTGFTTGNTDSGHTWIEEDQGPCPTGYHVPTTLEWDGLIKLWYLYRNGSCNASASSSCPLGSGETTIDNFKSDLKLPFAGSPRRSDGIVFGQGSNGNYWSSSTTGTNARYVYFYSSLVYPQNHVYRAFGGSVRCFKN